MGLERSTCTMPFIVAMALVLLTATGTAVAAPVVSTHGLIDWFDPGVGLTLDATGYVTAWANQGSGNAITGPLQQTSLVAGPNDTNMIRFDLGNHQAGLRYNPSGHLTDGYTIFAAVRVNDPIANWNDFQRFVRTADDQQVLFARKANPAGDTQIIAYPITQPGANRPTYLYTDGYALGDGEGGLGDLAILTARLEQDRQTLYFNGTPVAERTVSATVPYNVGASQWEIGNSVKGDIGNVLIYDNSLTDAGFDMTGMALAAHYGVAWQPTQPVVHWKLDGNLINSGIGGSQYNGTLVTGTSGSGQYVSGIFGQGLDLDSSPVSGVQGAHVASTYVPKDSGTFALWYHTAESFYNYETIFDNSVGANDWEFWIDQTGSARFRVNSAGPTVAYDLDNLEGPDNWYHMTVTWERQANPDQVAVQLYVDGIMRQSGIGAWIDPGELFLGGGNSGNTYATGIWDDVRIYERVLSAYEISTLMVPEPSALMLLAFVALGFAFRRHRRT